MIGGGVTEEYISRKEPNPPQFEESFQSEQTYLPDEREIMPSCDDCGVVFESVPELARHMNRGCPENNDLKRKRGNEEKDIPSKKSRVNEIDIEDGEDTAFIKLAGLAREANEDVWTDKLDKYMDGNMSEEHARHEVIDNETNNSYESEDSNDDDDDEEEEGEEDEDEEDVDDES
ncbi:46 kDa FK506-binding nuclear protein-like [Mytilus californianus]|uniref:46 kDa FK506-binding nuclear protein-like n=1 Tax=Mytilus californianus TaxID=6549 RepID=UPI002246335B|nr:46 kDa FK506-binding nuclear protein-like [Mytilus californianus]